ncbi:MAG TPA: hypothetical protein VHF88_09105 [Thermoleophilaceae bacterium]|nr:hypothetical protein [Thermoleophilaceae bacterium]
MKLRLPHLLWTLAAVFALAVTGCGDDDEPQGRKLPPEVTQTLLQQLDSVGDRVAAGVPGACDDIYASEAEGGNIEPIDNALSSIPANVDPEIRSALEQSVERLTQLVDQECAEIRSAAQDPDETVTEDDPPPVETVETETETVPVETTETTTTPPETTPTTPPETPETPPNGNGPDGTGPPGQDRGGAEAPDSEDEE